MSQKTGREDVNQRDIRRQETAEERERRLKRIRAQREAERKRRQELIFAAVFVGICILSVVIISSVVKKRDAKTKDEFLQSEGTESTEIRPSETDTAEIAPQNPDDKAQTEETLETTAETTAEKTEPPTLPPVTEEPETPEETVTEAPESTETEAPQPSQNVSNSIYIPSWIKQRFLTVSEWSRPGIALPQPVKNIVIHYVANPGSTAEGNREYFEDMQRTHERKVSAHFIVGLDGEILQLVPVEEMAYANYPRNEDTISIEVCHPDESGKYSDTTYWALVRLCAYLCEQYGFTSEDLIRHYDCNGKACPAYYVDHPEAWQALKDSVGEFMKEHPDIASELP